MRVLLACLGVAAAMCGCGRATLEEEDLALLDTGETWSHEEVKSGLRVTLVLPKTWTRTQGAEPVEFRRSLGSRGAVTCTLLTQEILGPEKRAALDEEVLDEIDQSLFKKLPGLCHNPKASRIADAESRLGGLPAWEIIEGLELGHTSSVYHTFVLVKRGSSIVLLFSYEVKAGLPAARAIHAEGARVREGIAKRFMASPL